MIRIVEKEMWQPVEKKRMHHSEDIFIRARDFYFEHEDYRNEQIAAVDDAGEILYMLAFEPNRMTYPGLSEEVKLNLYVSDFWKYEIDSPRMDFEYIEDIEVFCFEQAEEYSVQTARVILKYFPDKKIYFMDPKAALFFGEKVMIGEAPPDVEGTLLKVGSDMIYTIKFGSLVLKKQQANSINLMASIYWLSESESYGELNPEKVFYVIKAPIASSGLVKFMSFLLFFVMVACDKKEMNVIPVIDTAIPGDENQFNGGRWTDVWGMFFKPIFEYSLEEVYNSRNVVIGQEGKMGANPYLMYVEYHSNIGPLMKKYLRLNDKVDQYCRDVAKSLEIPEGAKVLGVIGRGTDFHNPAVATLHTLPLDPEGIVKKAKEMREAGGYDHIFLATEDQKVFDTFMASDLKSFTKYIDQNRYSIDASKEFLSNRYLKESEAGVRDGYRDTLVYISILEMLRRCSGIMASTDCGAVDYAMSMRNIPLEDLYVHGADTNEFLKNK